ncbi:MAG: YciI family protein [Nitrospirota bacterium]
MTILMINRVKAGTRPEDLQHVIPPHVEWLRQRMAEGKVLQAGKWGDIGGMWVLEAGSIEEARALVEQDPLISSGLTTYELAEFFPLSPK